jgi:DNA-binding XRE family transcriptional regulator
VSEVRGRPSDDRPDDEPATRGVYVKNGSNGETDRLEVVGCLMGEFVYQVGMVTGRHRDEHRAYLKAFGLNLKIERTRRGVSQEEFADIVGMHRTFYGQLERAARLQHRGTAPYRPRAGHAAGGAATEGGR